MFHLEATPYWLDPQASQQVGQSLAAIEARVALLRRMGTLTDQTLRDYYGEKRFEQVAESNALEGSTLSAGETELAVLKGITITGHDPAYLKDAIALDRALGKITELAQNRHTPTDIGQLHQVHALLLGERPGAGLFRRERVSIRGATHVPPRTWSEVMAQMEDWQNWSRHNATLPAPMRSVVLHAWLTHIHPYIDGNGRTARAIGNLELIRAGYPPIIIKKKEREHYIDALAESDAGGDIRSFTELVFDRIDGALLGLEASAKRKQGYDPLAEGLRQLQESRLRIWETSVRLLAQMIEHHVSTRLEALGGRCQARIYEAPVDLQDYIQLCQGRPVQGTSAFHLRVDIPGLPRFEKLAFIGYRSQRMYQHLGQQGGPALYWSSKNPTGYPKWVADPASSPFAVEITSLAEDGDQWCARLADHSLQGLQTAALARQVAQAVLQQLQTPR